MSWLIWVVVAAFVLVELFVWVRRAKPKPRPVLHIVMSADDHELRDIVKEHPGLDVRYEDPHTAIPKDGAN